MSNFDLSFTGAQVNSAINRVQNADTSPVNGSTNMITSDGVYDAVNNIEFANLNNNLVSTDLSSGNNNTTIPTTQAVANFIGGSNSTPWFSAYKTYSNIQSQVTLTSWGSSSQQNIGITESSGVFSLGSGHYHVTVTLQSGSNTKCKAYYQPTGGSNSQIGGMVIPYNKTDYGSSLVSIRGAGNLYVTVQRDGAGPGSGEATAYGAVVLTIFKLTDT